MMAWTLAQIHARHATTYGAHAQAASHTTGLTEAVVEARECAVFSERLRARIRSKYQVPSPRVRLLCACSTLLWRRPPLDP